MEKEISVSYDQFLALFPAKPRKKYKNGWYVQCSAHADSEPSLYIEPATNPDFTLNFKCYAGCDKDLILKSKDLTWANIQTKNNRHKSNTTEISRKEHPLIKISTFIYEDNNGGKLYIKERWQSDIPKDKVFYFKHLVNGKYEDGRGESKPVLYRLPELLQDIKNNKTIRIVGGEAKADKLREWGLPATCTDSGEGIGKWNPEYSQFFKGMETLIYQDNDKTGGQYTADILKTLLPLAKSVKVVIFKDLNEHGDILDWVKLGHMLDELIKIENETPVIVTTTSNKKPVFVWKEKAQTYNQLMIENLPEIKFTIDELLPRPGLGILAAKKKIGKSWFALDSAVKVSCGTPLFNRKTIKSNVVYFALEDGKRRINQRLKQMRAPRDLPITFFYEWPALNTLIGKKLLIEMLEELKPGYMVIDTLAASKNALVDENDNSQIADLINWFHQLTEKYNFSLLIIAHHGKNSTGDAGFDIRGGSAISGATDVNMGIYKQNDGSFNLVVEGRDIPELELTIKFNMTDWKWCVKGETKDIRRQQAEEKMLKALYVLGGKGSVMQIAQVAEVDRSTATSHLKRMIEEGTLFIDDEILKKKSKLIYCTSPTTPTITINPTTDIVEDVGDLSFEAKSMLGVGVIGDNEINGNKFQGDNSDSTYPGLPKGADF